jgi:predicted dehydrogenase
VMDIGCYPITMSRFIFGEEPRRVLSVVERDPEFGTDRLTSAILEFPSGQAIFNCSTQLVPYQRVQILGTKGRIEIEIPWNAPPDRPCRIVVDLGGEMFGAGQRIEKFPVCDQYTIQGDLFSRAILDNAEVPVPLEESIHNMAVIDAVLAGGIVSEIQQSVAN